MPDRRRPIRRAYAGEDVRELQSQRRGSASEIVASVAVYPGEAGRVAVLGPGEFFGELGLLAATTRSAHAVAEATTTCWRLSRALVEHLPAPLREELDTRLHTSWANANRTRRTAISQAPAP